MRYLTKKWKTITFTQFILDSTLCTNHPTLKLGALKVFAHISPAVLLRWEKHTKASGKRWENSVATSIIHPENLPPSNYKLSTWKYTKQLKCCVVKCVQVGVYGRERERGYLIVENLMKTPRIVDSPNRRHFCPYSRGHFHGKLHTVSDVPKGKVCFKISLHHGLLPISTNIFFKSPSAADRPMSTFTLNTLVYTFNASQRPSAGIFTDIP